MLTQAEITAYVEALQRATSVTRIDQAQQWEQLERRLHTPRQENRFHYDEWYREYEEQTGTLLGCD
jgi:hypothetical protein